MDGSQAQRDLYEWYLRLVRLRNPTYLTDSLLERIRTEPDSALMRDLKSLLAGEYASQGKFTDAEAIYFDLHRDAPTDALPLIALAGQKLYLEDQPEAALRIVDMALDAAFRSCNFRRYALGVKARAALTLKSFSIVEDVLRQLLQLTFEPGNLDCAIERDFFDRLPSGAVNQELARRFDEYSRPKQPST
jgi:hypothetical protein